MAHLYDLMLLIDAKAPEERRQAILSEVQSMLDSGGTIAGVHDWGTRRIAYEIDHRPRPTTSCSSSRARTSCSTG